MKHTQGKWTAHTKINAISVDGKKIIHCNNSRDVAIVAAAPELLKALQMIVDKRNGAGWDAECCALLAEEVIKIAS